MSGELVRRIAELSRPLEPLPTDCEPRLPSLDIHCVLFDVYGTLLISGSGDVGTAQERSSADMLHEALEQCGFGGDCLNIADEGADQLMDAIQQRHAELKAEGADFPEVDIRAVWLGLLHRWVGEGRLLGRVNEEAAARLAVEYEGRTNPVWPMPGCSEILASLKDTGVSMGIVSNAQFYTPLLFEALLGGTPASLGLNPDYCVWSYELLRAKPSSMMFEGVLSKLAENGIPAHKVLYVGNDMLNDVYTASRAGCRTALFAGDRRSLRLREGDERCAQLEPDCVLTQLDQLKTLLGRNS